MKIVVRFGVFAMAAACCSFASAQTSVFYNKPSAAAQAQVQSWGQKYVTLKTTGTPAAGAAAFAFTSPAMNSPLFSPLRAAELTVNLTTGSGSGCPEYAPFPGGDIVAFLTTGGLSSNIATETDKTLDLLEVAAEDDGVVLDIVGNNLVAMNLSPGQVSGSTGTAQWAGASTTTLTWIASLDEIVPGWAASLDPSDDAKRRLLGTPRTVDQLQAQLDAWSVVNSKDISTYQVEARFGSFGALPVIVAVYTNSPDSGFLLIDGMNGSVDGLFASGTAINPMNLLAGHSNAYMSGSPVQIVNAATGACAPVAKDWQEEAPPGWTPTPIVPGTPATQPGGRPANWGDYTCTDNGARGCTCTSKGTGTSGTPPTPTPTKVICYCGHSAGGGCDTAVTPGHPNIPPFTVPVGPAGFPGCTCTQQWFY